MRCDGCASELVDEATFCGRCGWKVLVPTDDDSTATTAWTVVRGSSASGPVRLDSDYDDEQPARRSNRVVWFGAASIAALGAFGLLMWAGLSGAGDKVATADRRGGGATTGSEPVEQWWTPPRGKRVSIEALAYAFTTVDERDLGAMFDKDLKPVYGAPHLYEEHEPRRLQRDEMSHSLVALRNTMQLNTGFNFLFVRFGTTRTTAHDYRLYRAIQVREVVSLDEDKRMREPPPEAVFYLAEVHRGACYDMLVEGDFSDVEDAFGFTDGRVGISAASLVGAGKLTINHVGLGLRPATGDAIFAITPAEVAARYETTDSPVPVKLVFKTIPGRGVKEKRIATPETLIDEAMALGEGEVRTWTLPRGKYRIKARSRPNGLRVEVVGDSKCRPSIPLDEYPSVESTCTVGEGQAALQITNPTVWTFGEIEQVTLHVSELPR